MHKSNTKYKGGDTTDVLVAGLPNIEGTSVANDGAWYESGAFFRSQTKGMTNCDAHNGSRNIISFDASLSNEIYGNSDTVQPPALSLLPQIKF